ncbi:hypothetical protein FKM82_004477 [Ascaphus truei]
MQQCHRLTGKCHCQEGFTGLRCDQCDRGFQDNFPRCSACHQCFSQWDLIITRLRQQLREIQRKVSDLQEGGQAPEISNSRIRDLEDKLRSIKQLIGDGGIEGTRVLEKMNKLVNKIRTEVAQLSYQLHAQEKRMNETEGKDRKQRGKLVKLTLDVNIVNETVFILQTQIEAVAAAGFNESYSSILKSYLESTAAERLANGSVSGPESPVSQSGQTRLETERLLKEKLDNYRRNMTAHRSSLKELQKKAQGLNVIQINEKICGAPGNQTCDRAACGGANCRHEDGRRKCGGENCNGAVPISTKALAVAQNVTVELENTANQLHDISQKIQEIQGIAQETKVQSEATLAKAKDAKRRIEDSTEKLRDFIRRIKDFLTEEGADPESIELVARQVLNISLPVRPNDIATLLKEIKDSIANLSGVDKILNSTSESLAIAKELLNQAVTAKNRAEDVGAKVSDVQKELEEAGAKAKSAEKALKKAKQSVRGVTTSVEESMNKMKAVEEKEMVIMEGLGNLSVAVEALLRKVESNRQMADEAKTKANKAVTATGGLDKEMDKVKKKYAELKIKVGGAGGASGTALDKVKKIQEEAKGLLKKVTDAKGKLDGLQDRFQTNEEDIRLKMEELQELEKKASGLLEYIRQQANAYSTC